MAGKPQEQLRNVSVETIHETAPEMKGDDHGVRVKVHLSGSTVRGEPGPHGETTTSHTVLTLSKAEADALVTAGKASYV
jgi:hypothetical protein